MGLARRFLLAVSLGRPDRLGLVLAFAAFYLVTGSRAQPGGDGSNAYGTANAIVERGELHMPFPAMPGRAGLSHSPHPLLDTLVHVPGAIVERIGRRWWPAGSDHLVAFGSHVGPALLGGLTCLLFFETCLLLGLRRTTSRIATIALGLGTIVCVYARSPWPPIVEAAAFIGFFAALLRTLRAPDRRASTALAIAFVFLIACKPAFAIMIPGVVALLVWQVRRRGLDSGWLLRRALPGLPVALVLTLVDSYLRHGSPWRSLASIFDMPFEQDLLMGMWGIFLSPGKSFLLYSPPLLLSVLGLRTLARREFGWVGWSMLFTVGPFVLYLARASFWTGPVAWGPPFLVFATPVLLLPAAVWLDDLLESRARRPLVVASAAVALGLFVQVVGSAIHWDAYDRVAREARTNWLGTQNRGAAFAPLRGETCDPCFEDSHVTTWLTPFQPVEGHYWLLTHVLKRHDWVQAEADATWHRYTSLQIPIGSSYPRARIDWWFLDFHPQRFGLGLLLLLLPASGLVAGVRWWWRDGPRPLPIADRGEA